MSGSGRETLQDVQEWEIGPPVCSAVVGRPSGMSWCGEEALPYVRKW